MSTSKSSKGSRASRITVACNSCRSRKQKCSGNKPICTQCLQSNRQCDWPEQLKRGPAKGYIEALEHRLHETEHVLLKLLAQMTDEQLSVAVERDQSLSQPRYPPFLRFGKNDAQYWRRYPLRTARELREWQQDCLNIEKLSSAETGVDGPPRTSPSRRTEFSGQSEVEADENSSVAYESQQIEQLSVPNFEQVTSTPEVGVARESAPVIHGNGMNQWVARKNGYDSPNELKRSPTAMGFIYVPSSLERTQLEDTQPLHASTPPGPSLWSEAPSVTFQRQFLW